MWENEKSFVQAISPFPARFSKRLLCQARQKVSLNENGLNKGLFGKGLAFNQITKILHLSKLKRAVTDDKLNATHKIKFVFLTIENIAGNQKFPSFPTMFSKDLAKMSVSFVEWMGIDG